MAYDLAENGLLRHNSADTANILGLLSTEVNSVAIPCSQKYPMTVDLVAAQKLLPLEQVSFGVGQASKDHVICHFHVVLRSYLAKDTGGAQAGPETPLWPVEHPS